MKWTDDNLDILENRKFSVVEVWRANREISDYSGLRAYERHLSFIGLRRVVAHRDPTG